MEELDRAQALTVVESLRSGTVSRRLASSYNVGRERHLRALTDDLDFVAAGGYKLRFLVGDWGYGKTHLLSLFAGRAIAADFAVSHVELHAREAPLERGEVIAAAIIANARFPGDIDIERRIRTWSAETELTDRVEIDDWLGGVSPSLEFRAILRAALGQSRTRGGPDLIADGVRWLVGGDPTPALTRETGIRGALKARVASELLTSFLRFVSATGARGLLLLLDEAEAITSLTRAAKRDEANQTLRRLLDNPEQRAHLEVVFATTSRFMSDTTRGARSYPALWARIAASGPIGMFNPRATVLELQPLTSEELGELGARIASVHALAHDWTPPVNAEDFQQLAARVFGTETSRPPRSFVRALVALLDLLQERPELTFGSLLDQLPPAGSDG